MKRIRITFSMLLVSIIASAQVQDVLDIVCHDRQRASGCEGPYRFETTAPTPAPKGYKPFYISHYGRHGSRYYWTADIYTRLRDVLEEAHKSGSLTARGEQLHSDYMSFYELPLINTGDLCDLGVQQHALIAGQMVSDFPGVFAKGGKVMALSSTSTRAVVSMGAFCTGLQKYAPKVEIVSRSTHADMMVANPPGAPSKMKKSYVDNLQEPESLAEFKDRKFSLDDVLDRLFSKPEELEKNSGRQFVYDLFALWQNYHNYTGGGWLEDIFTADDIRTLWEIDNYACYLGHSFKRYQQFPLLMDIIDRAEEAIQGSGYRAHLRFGHDTVFNSLCTLLNLDGCGKMPSDADDVKYWFQNYDTPMAATLQFVFYRSRRHEGILFKILRNGHEATMPQLDAVSGPYYRWNDFISWVEGIMAQHPEK